MAFSSTRTFSIVTIASMTLHNKRYVLLYMCVLTHIIAEAVLARMIAMALMYIDAR